MLQTNLIFGIQKKIKEGSKKTKDLGMLEESTSHEEVATNRAEPILESSFVAGMYQQAQKAKKKKETKKVMVTESFELPKARKKLEKDMAYFTYLYENFVDDIFKDQYKELLEGLFEDTINLYRECDVTPRLISQTLNSTELNENQIVDIYKNRLNESIKNNYTKPMLNGEITELYESQIKDLTKSLIQEGSEIDASQVKIYLPFEENFYQFNKSVLVPEIAQSRINLFLESVTDEYLAFLEESPQDMMQNMEKKIKLMTSMISPNVFDKVVDAEGVEAPKMAGISIAIDKNFAPDEDATSGCSMDAISDDLEAQEELADEDEAQEIEDSGENLVQAEDDTREDMDLATDAEDYEDIAEREEEAEESASEETAETGEQPGAIELELDVATDTPDVDSGLNVNSSDVALSGEGNDNGEDEGDGAQLPGGGEAIGVDIDSDDSSVSEEETEDLEDVSQENPDTDDAEEDVDDIDEDEMNSDGEIQKKIEEGTIQDKHPKAQTGKMGVKKTGTLPGGGTTQDKKPGSQGDAPSKEGSMDSSSTTQDKKPKAQNTSGTEGSMDSSSTTQDTNI